jgi:hypothetical protein
LPSACLLGKKRSSTADTRRLPGTGISTNRPRAGAAAATVGGRTDGHHITLLSAGYGMSSPRRRPTSEEEVSRGRESGSGLAAAQWLYTSLISKRASQPGDEREDGKDGRDRSVAPRSDSCPKPTPANYTRFTLNFLFLFYSLRFCYLFVDKFQNKLIDDK